MHSIKFHDYTIHDNGTVTKDGKGVRIIISKTRTAFVRLSINNRQDKLRLTTVMYKAFKNVDVTHVYHIDDDPTNCSLKNLTLSPPEKVLHEVPEGTVSQISELWTTTNATLERIAFISDTDINVVKLIVCGKLQDNVSLLPRCNYNKAVRVRFEQYESIEQALMFIGVEVLESDGVDLSFHFYNHEPTKQKAEKRKLFNEIKIHQVNNG